MQSTHAQIIPELRTIPDDELLRHLAELLAGSRHTEAALVAHIGEVDARRLYLREATPSMFAYCTERLHLSEAEACLRITAARASREHPAILEALADGRLHLSAIAKLGPHLTPDNRDGLLRRAIHRTKREIDELVAELAPRPDVPASVRKLPAGRFVARPGAAGRTHLVGGIAGRLGVEPRPEQAHSDRSDGLHASSAAPTPDAEGERERKQEAVCEQKAPQDRGGRCESEARPDIDGRLDAEAHPDLKLRWVAASPPRGAVIEPLAPARYRVQFTASAELREKLERLRDLMRSSIPDGDLAAIIEAAVSAKLERLEARRFGRTRSPRKSVLASDTRPQTRRVPAAVKRAVHERDEGRCRYVDAQGHRCTARVHLELHHRMPWAVGGDHSPTNVGLLCHAHNRYLAEIDYGPEAVGKHRRARAGSLAGQLELTAG